MLCSAAITTLCRLWQRSKVFIDIRNFKIKKWSSDREIGRMLNECFIKHRSLHLLIPNVNVRYERWIKITYHMFLVSPPAFLWSFESLGIWHPRLIHNKTTSIYNVLDCEQSLRMVTRARKWSEASESRGEAGEKASLQFPSRPIRSLQSCRA